ncbi:hypothetical protein ACFWQC_02085 [Nocardioides sp. NPDC058538]|uniref:hypothetical protein n=1 Tax=Nocardioides sp. NPDC058538 TaxID=3346542 RepID=UPI0036595552
MARPRKELVYRFSGPDTLDPAAIRQAVVTATAVQFSQGGFLIHAVDPEADVLEETTEKYVAVRRHGDGPRVTDRAAIAELIDALAVTDVTDMLCMCSGDFAAEFFDEKDRLLGVVRIDTPNRVEWPHWPGFGRLADPERLERWFARHWNSSPTESGDLASPPDPLLPYLVDLESRFDASAERPYDPMELVRYALGTTAYWADLAVSWLESTEIPVGTLRDELSSVEERVYWPQQLRHRAHRVRVMLDR